MEGDGPAKKRAKLCAKTTDDVPNEQVVPPSVGVVKSKSFDQIGSDDVKRKIPKAKSSSASSTSTTPSTSKKTVEFFSLKKAPKEEPADTSSMQITELNEQCLLEILQRMKLSDLCTMAEVCVKFKEVAQKFFAVKHRNISLSLLADTPDGKYSILKVRQLLYNFNHLISTLTIDLNRFENREDIGKMLSFVGKYCFGTIDELVVENQSNACVGEGVVLMMFGSQLLTRDIEEEGVYVTRNKMIFQPGKVIQEQVMARKEE